MSKIDSASLEFFYGDLPCPVIIREVETGLMLYANAAAARLSGFSEPGEMVGQSTDKLWPERAPDWRDRDRDALQNGTASNEIEIGAGRWLKVLRRRIDDGSVLVFSCDVTPEAQLSSLTLLSGSKVGDPRPVHESTLVALLLERASIKEICAALQRSPDSVFGDLAKVAGVPLG